MILNSYPPECERG